MFAYKGTKPAALGTPVDCAVVCWRYQKSLILVAVAWSWFHSLDPCPFLPTQHNSEYDNMDLEMLQEVVPMLKQQLEKSMLDRNYVQLERVRGCPNKRVALHPTRTKK